MKNLDLELFNVQALNNSEMNKINGGSEATEFIAYLLGYACHSIVKTASQPDYNFRAFTH